jgi:peptidoglycan/LPS O-acetylase OafA/YrhL
VSRRDPLVLGALVAGALGALLLFFFEEWFTRALGVLGLFAFVVAGVFAIATPSFLEGEREDE